MGEVKRRPMTFGYGRAKQAGASFSVGYVLFSRARVEYGLVHFGAGIGWHNTVSVSDGVVMRGYVSFR